MDKEKQRCLFDFFSLLKLPMLTVNQFFIQIRIFMGNTFSKSPLVCHYHHNDLLCIQSLDCFYQSIYQLFYRQQSFLHYCISGKNALHKLDIDSLENEKIIR